VTVLGPGATRARERKRARRGRWLRRAFAALLCLILLVGVFFAGLAIGRAIEQAPEPGGTQTRIRTLEPLTVPPQERTVTVTTAG
jgi:hypothetical protein